MISNEQLGALKINRVIFHDLPKSVRGSDAKPDLAEAETEIDATRRSHLQRKLAQVLGSKSAYGVQFAPITTSKLPEIIRSLTTKPATVEEFVAASQEIATTLFEMQTAAMSPGILAVIDAVANGKPSIILMKLEREAGTQLEKAQKNGKKTFAMSILDNLVLTDGTKLFKSAMFVRTGPDPDDFDAGVCDSQYHIGGSNDMARFWLRFLGCMVTVEPRVATEKFFDSTLRYLNDNVTDPVQLNDVYEHLLSELKSNRKQFSPKGFIEDYVPEEHQHQLREHLRKEGLSLNTFHKDTSDIESKLRRRAYRTEKGILLSVPEEHDEVIEVHATKVIVKDTLSKVGPR